MKERKWIRGQQCRWCIRPLDLPSVFPCCSGRCTEICPSKRNRSRGRTREPSPPRTAKIDTPSSPWCGGQKHMWSRKMKRKQSPSGVTQDESREVSPNRLKYSLKRNWEKRLVSEAIQNSSLELNYHLSTFLFGHHGPIWTDGLGYRLNMNHF